MTNETNLRGDTEAIQPDAIAEKKRRDTWFTATPDPWVEIVHLDYDGDRTFASTVNRMVVSAEPDQRPVMEARLLETLARPELTMAGRLFICRMLGLIGSAACVAAVAPMLRDEATADFARMALDRIDDPAVDAAYREALGRLKGAAKGGLIGSIVRRGDAGAIEELTAIAMDASEAMEVRAVAERAVEQLTAKA